MAEQSGSPKGSLESILGQSPSSSQRLSPEQENAFVKELTQYTSTTSRPVKEGVYKIFREYGANLDDYAVCIISASIHTQQLVIYTGKVEPRITPGLVPPKLLQDLQMPGFCEDHKDELGIKTALGITPDGMKDISYYVIPKGDKLGNEFLDKMIKTVEEYREEQLGYRLIQFKPVFTSHQRYAIVFREKNITTDKMLAVYESIKGGKPITKSELLAAESRQVAESKLNAEFDNIFKEAEKGPPSTTPLSTEDYAQRTVEIGSTYLVEELRKPIKPEYASAINRLLAGAGQSAYKIDHLDPRKIMFFIGDKPNEYTDPQSGKEKRELAIKGMLDMQLTLEMHIAGKSLGDKSIGEKGYDPTTFNFLGIRK